MTQSLLMTAILASAAGPAGLLPCFRDSLLAGRVDGALEMVSQDAMAEVDSVLENHPGQVAGMLSYFGLPPEMGEGNTGGAGFLAAVLGSPQVPALILLLGVTPVEPVERDGMTFVPVSFGLYGARDTVFVRIVPEGDEWLIRDYFEELPAVQAGRSGRG